KIVPYPRFISLLLEHMMPEYDNEELTINPTQVFSVNNWTLKPNQPEEPPFTTQTKSSSAKDKSLSHPLPPTLSASGHDASADSTAEADPGLSAPNDSISS
ncbi:hypothetical protein Tco_1564388, partial [Tanacetum coccineum]